MPVPIDAIAVNFYTPVLSGGLGMGLDWIGTSGTVNGKLLKVWTNRMQGDGTADPLGQATHLLVPQTVFRPYSTKEASDGTRWAKYPVEVAYYDFDYELARTRIGMIHDAYFPFRGHASGTPLFIIPGWQGQLWDIVNKEVVGCVESQTPRLWKAVVNLYFENFEPIL